MSTQSTQVSGETRFVGNDRVLFGIIFGVLAFWLFAQTTLNISSVMANDLGIETSVMNIAVSITALFSGIFIVVIGGLADRFGRVKLMQGGFVLSIVGSLLVGLAPSGSLASLFLMLGRILQGLSGAFIMPASLALQVALHSEEKAWSFFNDAIEHTSDTEVRTLFEELRGEELEHQELVRRQMALLPKEVPIDVDDFVDDPVAQ